jgi:hypothetical protein
VSLLYYGPYWSTAAGAGERQFNDGFARFIGTSSVNGVLSQYGAAAPAFAGSSVISSSPPQRITETQVQDLVRRQLAAGTDPETIHTVILPPGASLDQPAGTAGYHGSMRGTFAGPNGSPIYYAVIDPDGIDFDGSRRDAMTIVQSHEWAETATDPDVNRGTLGWYDDNNGEIGDIALDLRDPSQVFERVGPYAVQLEWSNKDGALEVAPKG